MEGSQEVATKRHMKVGALLTLCGVQIIDFVSDLAVVIQWYLEGQNVLANIWMGSHVAVVILGFLGAYHYFFDRRGFGLSNQFPFVFKVILFVLIPILNLQVLATGLTMDMNNNNHNVLFFAAKGFDAEYKSLPMAVLTIFYICTTDPSFERESTSLVMMPSLILSALSIGYGMTSAVMHENNFRGLKSGLRLFCYFLVDEIWLLANCWGLFITSQSVVLLYVLGVQVFSVLCTYAVVNRILRRVEGSTVGYRFLFYTMHFVTFLLFDPTMRFAVHPDPKAHFAYAHAFVARRGCLLTMSILSLTAIAAPPWGWFLFLLGVCLHTLLTIWVYSADEVCRKAMNDRFFFLFHYAPNLFQYCPNFIQYFQTFFKNTPKVMPEAGEINLVTDIPAKVHECLRDLVRHEAWSDERVKRFVDAAEGVLRTNSIRGCTKSKRAVEYLIKTLSKSIQVCYPDLLESKLLKESLELLCSYKPPVPVKKKPVVDSKPHADDEKLVDSNKLLQDGIRQLLQNYGICFLDHDQPVQIVEQGKHLYQKPQRAGGLYVGQVPDIQRAKVLKPLPQAVGQTSPAPVLKPLKPLLLSRPQESIPGKWPIHPVQGIPLARILKPLPPVPWRPPCGVQAQAPPDKHDGIAKVAAGCDLHTCSQYPQQAQWLSNQLYVGQHVFALEPDNQRDANMRAVPLMHAANILLWKSSEGTPEQYALSQPADHCATFISHSWSDPWWIKATMLRNHLFLLEYDSAVFILGLLCAMQALPMSFLLQAVAGTALAFLPFYIIMSGMAFASLRAHLTGWLLPSTWGPWPRKLDESNGIWLDKLCIDQATDSAKQAGIANLGIYLLKCKTMTVMLGDTYFSRLWTTFELATYCKVHQGQLEDRLFFVSLKWATTWRISWLFQRVELDQFEIEQLTKYSCLDADCFMPADRVVVLAAIRKTWGSEQNFDNFVKTELSELVRKGKEEFMWRSLYTIKRVLDMLF